MRAWILGLGLVFGCLAFGCASSGDDPDAGRTRMDASAQDAARADAATDTGAGSDAASLDAGGGDSGASSIVIDGLVTEAEWTGAAAAANATVSAWGDSGLERLRATVAGADLYVALEATLEVGAENTLVLYVDADLGRGTGVSDLFSLTDGVDPLDNGLSAGFNTPTGFGADRAWGTRDLDRAQVGLDPRMGWRDIATDPADFAWIDAADAPTVCGPAACETRIALSSLGGSPGDTIALFARLVNTDGTQFSNETLPEDDPADPQTVTQLLEVSR